VSYVNGFNEEVREQPVLHTTDTYLLLLVKNKTLTRIVLYI